MSLKVGVDPEFFLKRDNQNVSAHDIVPGSKHKPHRLSCGAVQADGTAVEFNIDPAGNLPDFVRNIKRTLQDVRAIVPPDLVFDISPAVIYPVNYFTHQIPQSAKDLGCDVDYNAYNGQPNPRPNGSGSMRTGAGHIHLGWTELKNPLDRSHFWDCCEVTRACDTYFDQISKLWDKDNMRRSMYGNLGAFRPKPYGVEYRVLSNAWLNYPNLWPWLFQSVKFVWNFLRIEGYYPPFDAHVQNHSKSSVNRFLCQMWGDDVPKIPENWDAR